MGVNLRAMAMAGAATSCRRRWTRIPKPENGVSKAPHSHTLLQRACLRPTSVVISSRSDAACACAFAPSAALAAFAKLKAIFALRYSGPSSCEGVGGVVGCSASNDRWPSGAACVMLMVRGARGSLGGLARKSSRNLLLGIVVLVFGLELSV